MKLITRETDYAARALTYMAQSKKGVVTVRELADELDMPRPFLRRILQKLNKGRLLNSTKGQDGGFSLARPAEKIFLVDLVEVFQGPVNFNNCMLKKRICPNTSSCVLRSKIDNIQRNVKQELKSITIASLL